MAARILRGKKAHLSTRLIVILADPAVAAASAIRGVIASPEEVV